MLHLVSEVVGAVFACFVFMYLAARVQSCSALFSASLAVCAPFPAILAVHHKFSHSHRHGNIKCLGSCSPDGHKALPYIQMSFSNQVINAIFCSTAMTSVHLCADSCELPICSQLMWQLHYDRWQSLDSQNFFFWIMPRYAACHQCINDHAAANSAKCTVHRTYASTTMVVIFMPPQVP